MTDILSFQTVNFWQDKYCEGFLLRVVWRMRFGLVLYAMQKASSIFSGVCHCLSVCVSLCPRENGRTLQYCLLGTVYVIDFYQMTPIMRVYACYEY